jgi:hypothetical protein
MTHQPPTPASLRSTSHRRRPRNSIGMEVVVNLASQVSIARLPQIVRKTYIGSISRISSLERPRNTDRSRIRSPRATSNTDLRAADVELRRASRVVDGQRLDAEEVLAVLDAPRDVICIIRYNLSASISFQIQHAWAEIRNIHLKGQVACPPLNVGPQS